MSSENKEIKQCPDYCEKIKHEQCDCPFCFEREEKEEKEPSFTISIKYKEFVEEWLKEEKINHTMEVVEDYTKKLVEETGEELLNYFYHKIKDVFIFEISNIHQLELIDKTIRKAECGYCSKILIVDWDSYSYDHVECGDCTSQGKEAFVCNECAKTNAYICPVCKKKENLFPPPEMWTDHPNHWSDCVTEEDEEENLEESTRGKERREKRGIKPSSSS